MLPEQGSGSLTNYGSDGSPVRERNRIEIRE